jgi:hypothetical protein
MFLNFLALGAASNVSKDLKKDENNSKKLFKNN